MKNVYPLKQLFALSSKIETFMEVAILTYLGNNYAEDEKKEVEYLK